MLGRPERVGQDDAARDDQRDPEIRVGPRRGFRAQHSEQWQRHKTARRLCDPELRDRPSLPFPVQERRDVWAYWEDRAIEVPGFARLGESQGLDGPCRAELLLGPTGGEALGRRVPEDTPGEQSPRNRTSSSWTNRSRTSTSEPGLRSSGFCLEYMQTGRPC